jgi:hypothetical protein
VRHDCIEPLGLTITEAAEALGVTRQTLNNLVNGESGISADIWRSVSTRHSAAARKRGCGCKWRTTSRKPTSTKPTSTSNQYPAVMVVAVVLLLRQDEHCADQREIAGGKNSYRDGTRLRFARDSPLERAGFELPVPLATVSL